MRLRDKYTRLVFDTQLHSRVQCVCMINTHHGYWRCAIQELCDSNGEISKPGHMALPTGRGTDHHNVGRHVSCVSEEFRPTIRSTHYHHIITHYCVKLKRRFRPVRRSVPMCAIFSKTKKHQKGRENLKKQSTRG